MQEKRHGTARFVLNKEGQLEHLIQIGGYTFLLRFLLRLFYKFSENMPLSAACKKTQGKL